MSDHRIVPDSPGREITRVHRPETVLTDQEREGLIASVLYEAQQVLTHAAFFIPVGKYSHPQWLTLERTLEELAEVIPHVREGSRRHAEPRH